MVLAAILLAAATVVLAILIARPSRAIGDRSPALAPVRVRRAGRRSPRARG
jgi:hypothetical protein